LTRLAALNYSLEKLNDNYKKRFAVERSAYLRNGLVVNLLLVFILFVFSPQYSLAKMYKWVDENGQIHWSDTPPPVDEKAEILKEYETVEDKAKSKDLYYAPPKKSHYKKRKPKTSQISKKPVESLGKKGGRSGGYPTNARWTLYEETSIPGRMGKIKKGCIFKTRSRHVYEVADYVHIYQYEHNPNVIVLSDGTLFKLIIDGFDEPLVCKCLNCLGSPVAPQPALTPDVIKSQIDGDFEGWEGETIVKLVNGQIWQQIEYYYEYYYAVMPEVLIYRFDGIYKMKVEGTETAVGVDRLK